MNELERIIWAAGVFDGEASAVIEKTPYKEHATYHPRINLLMTHKPTIEEFVKVCGKRRINRFVNKQKETAKCAWYISCNGKDVYNFLTTILPYTVTKRDEVVLLLEFIEFKKTLKWGDHSKDHILDKYYRELQRLKKVEYLV